MPHHKSAKKRLRKSGQQNEANRSARAAIRTLARQVDEAKTPEEGKVALDQLLPRLDRAQKSGLYHRNTVARKKSRAQKLVNRLAGDA